MAGVVRKTGMTGLKVAKSPHYTLTRLYDKILRACKNMPETSAYRKNTESIVQNRLSVVQNESDLSLIETKINSGCVEELIIQAENELLLSRKMIGWKAWEPLQQQPPLNQWKWPL
ncbi:NDUFA5 (predicted) [Pycnogonum litorale]